MKIAMVSSVVPFTNGGYRNIVDWVAPELQKAGHQVETVWLPFDETPDQVLPQMLNYRLMRLEDSCDRIITFRPPSHMVCHPQKVVWFIHHLRVFFDLWATPYSSIPDTVRWRSVRDSICEADTHGLREASAVFSNSKIVTDRLKKFNGIDSQVLYPPVSSPARFHNDAYGDELLFICRIEDHKRQHLALEAMRYTKSPVRMRICGAGTDHYVMSLKKQIREAGLADRVTLDNRWISEDEKVQLLSRALANIYLAADEDSYGYPTLEAAHSSKATITVDDAGGVSEFVVDGSCGSIVPNDPHALAETFDLYFGNRDLARRRGAAARARIDELEINWDRVVRALTGRIGSKS
jgi:glycosyltransferase involved in cell wall biosynthesis